MERENSEDAAPHLLLVVDTGEERYYEVEHPPECQKEYFVLEGISGDQEAFEKFERYTCRVAWVCEGWGLDFLQLAGELKGHEGWEKLAPGLYPIMGFTDYSPGELGGTWGEEWDTGVYVLEDVPISDRITMRPVWRRRQRRHYMLSALLAPTDEEIQDAILVLADPENETFAPALWIEAFNIFEEASRV